MGFKDRKGEPEPETVTPTKGKKERWTPAVEQIDSDHVPSWEKTSELKHRVVLASSGRQKRGKSTFGFSLPDPLAYLQFDANYEHALQAARSQKRHKKARDIKHIRYFADPRGDLKSSNAKEFNRFVNDFYYCLPKFRGIFVDTLTEALDFRKLAEYGRNTQIMQMYYGSIYADFRFLVKEALNSNCSVIFAHRMKDEYLNDARTGNSILDGWKGIVYETQAYVEHDRAAEDGPPVFSTTIVDCTQNALLMGHTLSSEEDENDFPHLAQRIFPNTDLEDWQ